MTFSFRPQYEYPILRPTNGEQRYGRYHNSNFSNVEKGYYVVAVFIEHDDIASLLKTHSMNDIVKMACTQFNTPIIEGKRKKKEVLPYGNLSIFQHQFKQYSNGKYYISALLLTNDSKNDNFWGEGLKR